MRTKLKNFITGNIVDKTFRGGENVDSATVEKRETQFSYVDGDEVGPRFFTPAETDRASGGLFLLRDRRRRNSALLRAPWPSFSTPPGPPQPRQHGNTSSSGGCAL